MGRMTNSDNDHNEISHQSNKTVKNINIVLAISLPIISIVLICSYLWNALQYELSIHQASSVASAIDYALINEKAWFNSAVPASSYKGQCDLINGELTPKKASHGKLQAKTVCTITRAAASKDYCWFWWLGRNCITVEVIHSVFREERFRILIVSITN